MSRRITPQNAGPLLDAGIAVVVGGRVELADPHDGDPAEWRFPRSGGNVGRCDRCGGSLAGARTDKRYCSDRCRQAAHRARLRGGERDGS